MTSCIFFTADTHFGHRNIIKYCARPFESLAEHNETLIENWNSVVQPNDHVYHLGDVGFGSPDYLYRVLQRLNGKLYLIKGNHDDSAIREPASQRFQFIKDVHVLKTQHKGKKVQLFLSHYAHRTWLRSNHGSIHLFGHSHGNMPPHGLSFDVGVDCWNFTPISLDAVIEKAGALQIQLDYDPEIKLPE
jgi:calcineurin-like phosphoesterase family protein